MTTLRQFLFFTAVSLPACALLILWVDQPLALFVHRHGGWAVPFFEAYTNAVDTGYSASMTNIGGVPFLLAALVLAYALVRWVLRKPWGNIFLVVLLTHLASVVASNMLKGAVHRLRPDVLFSKGYTGTGLWASGPDNDSFPSSHTTGYFSLFLPLAVVFPRWRVPLLVLPGLIAIGRLVLGAHYLSDVWFSLWLVMAFTFVFGLLQRPVQQEQSKK